VSPGIGELLQQTFMHLPETGPRDSLLSIHASSLKVMD